MYGTFEDGFKGKEKKIEEIEEGKDEKLTSGLVPIINSNDLDKYATKFLKEFCPKALKEPTKLSKKGEQQKPVPPLKALLTDKLFNLSRLADSVAQVVKLRSANLTLAYKLNLGNAG